MTITYDPTTPLPVYTPSTPSNTLEEDDHDDLLHQTDRVELIGLKSAVGLSLGTPARGKAIIASGTGTSAWDTVERKNLLHNGAMRVNQRVTMPTGDNLYCLDRWRLELEAANAATIAQDTADVPTDGSKYVAKLVVGSGNNNKFGLWQVLEYIDVSHLRGKRVSLQFKMKATAGIADVRAGVAEFTGTADAVSGDPISAWGAAGTNPTLAASWAFDNTPANLTPTTSWATYRVENIPIGASMNNLAVFIWCDDKTTTQTTDILRITDVQIEEGAVCTDVDRIPFRQALADCQRYYENSYEYGTAPGTAITDGSHYVLAQADVVTTKEAVIAVQCMVPKRVAPTISFWDLAGNATRVTTLNASGGNTSNVAASFGPTAITTRRWLMIHSMTNAGMAFHWAENAEL